MGTWTDRFFWVDARVSPQKNLLLRLQNKILDLSMYKLLIRPIFFLLPPERAHHVAMWSLRVVLGIPLLGALAKKRWRVEDERLQKECMGLTFRNPLGIAAGFDKDGRYIDLLDALGFGFLELGTVTPLPQSGNPKPRLFRLKNDKALINRMGFNNRGVDALREQLKKVKDKKIIIGGNIGKNKITPNDEAYKDYLICFEKLHPYVDYFVVNVSSPNTPGLRSLQEKKPLDKILSSLQTVNSKLERPKPLLLKIAPDLHDGQLDDVIEIVIKNNLDGIIATNTTIHRSGLRITKALLEKIGAGGLSGAPIRERSNDILRQVVHKTDGKLIVIGVGGIFSYQDVLIKQQIGAELYQVFTGFVYEGPDLVRKILRSLSLQA